MKLASKAIFIAIICALALGFVGGTATAADASQQVQFATPIAIANTSFLNVRTGPGVKYNVLLTVVGGTQLPVLGVAEDRVWYQVSTVVGVGWLNSEFVIARGDFTNVPSVDTSTLALSAYLGGGPATVGFIDGQGGGGSPIIAASAAPIGGTFVAGIDADGNPIIILPNERYRATLNVPAVDLRTAPSDSAPSLGTLFGPGNADYPIVNRGHDTGNVEWLAVITPQYGTGWIDSPKLHIRLSGAFRTVMVVVADTIGMRPSPGTNGGNLPVLTRGIEGFLTDISQDGKFIELELGGGERGWIPFDSAQARTGTPTDGLKLDPNVYLAGAGGGGAAVQGLPAPLSLSVPHIVVNTSYLNVRSGPGANYTSVATVSGGTELPVLGVAKDRVWFLVQGDFGRGWLNNEFTVFRGVYDNVPVINTAVVVGQIAQPVVIISSPTVLYAAPGTNFGSIATISGPAELVIVARTADSTWVQVNTQFGFGWILSSQVLLRGDLSVVPVVN